MRLFYITYAYEKGQSPYMARRGETVHCSFEYYSETDIAFFKWREKREPDVAPTVANTDNDLSKAMPFFMAKMCFKDPEWPRKYVETKNADMTPDDKAKYRLVLMSFDFPIEGKTVDVRELEPRNSCKNCLFSYEYDDGDGDDWPDSCVLFHRTGCGSDAPSGFPHVNHCDHGYICPLWKRWDDHDAEEVKESPHDTP